MNTYIIEARSLDQGYPVSKTITADSEKQAKKGLTPLPIGKCLTTAKIFLTRQIESHPFRGRFRL